MAGIDIKELQTIVLTLSDDGIAEIRLNRPEALNSIDPVMRAELQYAWEFIESPEVRIAILTGTGPKAFCTGSDLKKTMPPAESYAQLKFGRHPDNHLLSGIGQKTPIIAAVNGIAVGGGLELALACDIRIAANTASFGLPEVRVGSIPGAGGSQRLPRLIGESMATYMLLTGDRIGADRAVEVGLISEAVDPEELLPRAREIASRIAANAPLSVSAVKHLIDRGRDLPYEQGLDLENYVWGLLRDTEDRIEGRRAFAEKRPPVYQGK
jgi:E-phenylitaconyl-CoA hydratase